MGTSVEERRLGTGLIGPLPLPRGNLPLSPSVYDNVREGIHVFVVSSPYGRPMELRRRDRDGVHAFLIIAVEDFIPNDDRVDHK